MTTRTDDLRSAMASHPDVDIVGEDDAGRVTIEVPNTIPSDLDRRLRDADADVTRKTPTRFEVQT